MDNIPTAASALPKKQRRRRATPRQRLFTIKQIEDEYGVPGRSVYGLIVSGQLAAVQFEEGGQYWVRRETWEALIERQTAR
jgi:hypothetical protein